MYLNTTFDIGGVLHGGEMATLATGEGAYIALLNVGPNYFTIILQSSVGTLEGHSEVGVYLASFCVPN